MACSAGEDAQVENRGIVNKNPDNYKLGDELEFLGEANDINVSGLIIGSRFNVSKVFEEGTNVAIQSTTNNGNTHGNAEYNSLYQISVNSNGHGLSVGYPITISDIAPAGAANSLDGDWYVASVTDSDNFIIYITANASNATSGNVKVAEGFEFFLQSEKTNTHVLEYESYLAQPVFAKKIALSMGYIHMPNPPYGIYHQKRLVVPFFYDVDDNGLTSDRGNRDELLMSDLLDTDTL